MYTSGTFALSSVQLTQLMLISMKENKNLPPGLSDQNKQWLLINIQC